MCIGNALNYLKNCIVIYSFKKDPPVCKQLHMILHIQIKCVLKLLYLRNSSLHMQMYLWKHYYIHLHTFYQLQVKKGTEE